MAARSRITVLLLLFLLSTEHSFAVNLNELTPLVKELLNKYRVNDMFSLAVSIPQNQNPNKILIQDQNQDQDQDQGWQREKKTNKKQDAFQIFQKVLNSDPAINVKKQIDGGGVYVGNRMVAAEINTDHVELRVVNNWDQLVDSQQVNDQDLLLFYVRASPCVEKCTKDKAEGSILSKINKIRRWKNYAVVFSKIFKPHDGPENTEEERRESLKRLATYQGKLGPIGLENIFRCDGEKNQPFKCVSCSSPSSDRGVADRCVSNDQHSGNTNTGQQQGTGGSSSLRGGQASMQSGRGRGSSNPRGHRGRRDISYNTGDSSAHISESNKGAEDAPSVDENGNDAATGESVSLSPKGSDEGNGSDLRTVEDVLSPHIGFDSGDGRVSKGKGKVSKGKGGKGRRGKGKEEKEKEGKGKGEEGNEKEQARGEKQKTGFGPGLDFCLRFLRSIK